MKEPKEENSVFLNAVINGKYELVKRLVSGKNEIVKCDINQKGTNDNSALMLAIFHGHSDIAQFLIEQGADVTHKNCFGMTALSSARLEQKMGNGFYRVIDMLERAGEKS